MFNKLSLSEQVEDALRLEITEGRVLPGQRVSIADYQDTWKVSSTPFRDAVRALEMQGFVIVEPRKGVFVATMDAATVKEVFDLRIALECMAVELATDLVPQETADETHDVYLAMRADLAAGDHSTLLARDRAVHDMARENCGNRRLQRLLAGQMDLISWVQNSIVRKMPNSVEVALPEHIAIMDAVCARDADAAVRAMRRHLENSRERLLAHLGDADVKPKKKSR